MAEKILNTRILLKYDTYANWSTNNPVLKAGEMAIATVANNENNAAATGFTNLPNVVIKIGDGVNHYNDLKFVSALAADVHGWAKAANKPSYTYTEIGGLEDYMADVAQGADTNTKYALVSVDADNYKYELRSQDIGQTEWTKVADLDLSGLVSRISALEGLVGNTKVSTQIQTAIEALDADKVIVAQGEIIESVEETDGVVTVTKRALVKEDIPTIEQAQVNGLPKALEDLNKAVTDGDAAALASAKEYSDAQLKAVKEALDYNGGEFGEHKFATKITENDGVIEAEYAQPQIADIAGLETRLSEIEGSTGDLGDDKQDKLAFDGEYNEETNKVATVSSVVTRIQALDYDGGAHGEHKFVTKVTEADGIIAAEYDVPEIADVNGLTEEISRLDGRIDTKQDALTFTSTPNDSDNRVATEKYVTEAVADLNGAMHFIGKVDELPTDNTGFSAGDVVLLGYDEYVFDGNEWLALGNESIYQTKELAAEQHEVMVKTVTDLSGRHDSEMAALEKKHDDELLALDTKFDNAIKALDKDDAAVEGEFVTAVSEADGVITVTRAALKASDIPELAQSKITGLVDKIAELENEIEAAQNGATGDAKDYVDSQLKAKVEALDYNDAAVAGQFVTAVTEADGVIAVTRAALQASDIPVISQAQVENLASDIAAAAKAGTDAAAQSLTDANKYTDDTKTALIASLKNTDAAVEKNFVTEVKQADGVVTVQRAPVADIALTGSTDDLVQGEKVLIFNCGNSQICTANEFVM